MINGSRQFQDFPLGIHKADGRAPRYPPPNTAPSASAALFTIQRWSSLPPRGINHESPSAVAHKRYRASV
jgi:hypothetical protein